MKTSVVVFLFGTILLCTNASILEHIYNNTHLRGKVRMDTKDGVKIGYDGRVSFGEGPFGLEIANVGLDLIAKPEGAIGNATNGTIKYAGGVRFSAGQQHADLGVNGTAGLFALYDVQPSPEGGAVDYLSSLSNFGEWRAFAGDTRAGGDYGGILNVSGRAVKDGPNVLLRQGAIGFHGVKGKSQTGGPRGDRHIFAVFSKGRGGLQQGLTLAPVPPGGAFPSVTYVGESNYQASKDVKFDRDDAKYTSEGGAKFNGLVWIGRDENNETVVQKIQHVKNTDFGSKGYTIVNDHLVSLDGTVGTISEVNGANLYLTKDGQNASLIVFDSGDLHSSGVLIPTAGPGDRERLAKELERLKGLKGFEFDGEKIKEMDLQDDGHDGHAIKTLIHAKWAGGKGTHAHRNDDNSTGVHSLGGVGWEVDGIDSIGKKPWHTHGGFGYKSGFIIDPAQAGIRNATLNFEMDPKQVEALKQGSQQLEAMIAQRQ